MEADVNKMKRKFSRAVALTLLVLLSIYAFGDFLHSDFGVGTVKAASIFSDGFETGDLSKWDVSYATGSGVNSVESTNVYAGAHAFSSKVTDAEGFSDATLMFNEFAGSTVYLRAYLYIDQFDVTGAFANRGILSLVRFYNYRVASVIIDSTRHLGLWYYNNGFFVNIVYSATTIPMGQWFCLEVGCKEGAGDGEISVYLNGAIVDDIHITGLTNNADLINCAEPGVDSSTGVNFTLFIDDCVVDSSYIGPELSLGELIIQKMDQAGNIITAAGATFSISPNPFTGSATPLTVVDNDGSDSNPDIGTIDLKNVLLTTYTVTETAAPAGYEKDPTPQDVTISSSVVVTISFTNKLGELIIQKKDPFSNIIDLPGVTFTVSPNPYGVGTLTVVDNDANDANTANGMINLKNVPLGTYTVAETVAPAGYALDSTPHDVTISSSVVVTISFTNAPRPNLQMTPDSITCRKYAETFAVQVAVSDAFNVIGFEFEIHFNASQLQVDSVTYTAWPGSGTPSIDNVNGIVTGSTSGSALARGTVTLITIEFQATLMHMWKAIAGWQNLQTSTIFIQAAGLSYSNPQGELQYVKGGTGNQITVGPDIAYTFSPIKGDINNDGTVDITDLSRVASYYGMTSTDSGWDEASKYDLNGDNTIDIFDLVYVASNFWFTYP